MDAKNTPAPVSAAQRRARYRQRRDTGDGQYRISVWLSSHARFALERLAGHRGLTRQQLLEQLLSAADDEVLAGIEVDTPQWDRYFGATR